MKFKGKLLLEVDVEPVRYEKVEEPSVWTKNFCRCFKSLSLMVSEKKR